MRAKTWDEQQHKVLRILTTGLIWKPTKATWFGKWVNPIQYDHNHKMQSLLKPWYVAAAISLFFGLLLKGGSVNLALGVWGIVIPLGLAAIMTWSTICVFVAGEEHAVEGFYFAQATMAAAVVAMSAHQRAQEQARKDYELQVAAHKEALDQHARQQRGLPF